MNLRMELNAVGRLPFDAVGRKGHIFGAGQLREKYLWLQRRLDPGGLCGIFCGGIA